MFKEINRVNCCHDGSKGNNGNDGRNNGNDKELDAIVDSISSAIIRLKAKESNKESALNSEDKQSKVKRTGLMETDSQSGEKLKNINNNKKED